MRSLQNNLPFISIIIPCRNEEKFIERCLSSILAQNYPEDKTEVLVVDGMSEDKTRTIIENYKLKTKNLKLLDNPRKFTPFAFNIGVKEARGDIVMLMGAHAGYEKDYVSKCISYLRTYNADNIGGIIKTIPRENTTIAKAIALALSNSFGVGGATFRGGSKKIKRVDTVFGGCYNKEVFKRVGLFNEKLLRSQDMEFNIRVKRAGGKILLAPDIISYYYPKSNLKDFFWHNFKDGVWAIYPLRFVKIPFKLRHYISLIFVLTLPISIWPYMLISLFFSAQIALREKDIKLFFLMPLAFGARHFGYGSGSFIGLVKLLKK